jgi:hypothetical protein
MAIEITIREGFFHSDRKDEKHFPRARSRNIHWLGRREFLDALAKVQESKKVTVETYKGQSKCRCCDEKNGADEFSMKLGPITTVWPEGLAHYIEIHNVRPGLAFQELILQVAATIK